MNNGKKAGGTQRMAGLAIFTALIVVLTVLSPPSCGVRRFCGYMIQQSADLVNCELNAPMRVKYASRTSWKRNKTSAISADG